MPGNFHISMHNQIEEFKILFMTKGYIPNLDHQVNRLDFGSKGQDINVGKISKDFSVDV